MKLRQRFALHIVMLTAHVVVFTAAALWVVWPGLRHVDDTLAPLQEVFLELHARQGRLVAELSEVRTQVNHESEAHAHGGRASTREAERSLLARHGRHLDPVTVEVLADVEDTYGRIELALAEAVALHELGDQRGAEAVLAGIDRQWSDLLEKAGLAQIAVLEQGIAARTGLQDALRMLRWLGVAWAVSLVTLLSFIAYDVNRTVLRPIRAFDVGVRRLADGDWTEPIEASGAVAELRVLADDFNEMADVLRRRAGQHAQLVTAGELLAGVAHELNNPLQAIRGTAELNKDNVRDTSSDWHEVTKQSRRASKLVRDLLRFVRARHRSSRPTELNDAVSDALNLVAFQFRADGIDIELSLEPDLPPVLIDPDELVGVLVNLLGNAHRVQQQHGGRRQLEVQTTTSHQGGWVTVTVSDSGPGIAPEFRQRVFDPFFTTREGGVGLGLAVSRDTVRRAGGELRLDETSSGASFTVALPAAPRTGLPAITDADSAVPRREFAGVSFLVVDDERAIRDVLVRFLEGLGATVEAAGSGRAALAAIERRRFDMVVLDLRMPDVDGLEVYRRLAQRHPELSARTIILSGDVSQLNRAGLDIPARRILLKPVELDRLRGAVSDVLDRTMHTA